MFVFGAIFWAVGIAVVIVAALVTNLTPALFQLCIYLEWQLANTLEQLTGQSTSHGLVILVSLLGWGGVGALAGGLLLGSSFGAAPLLVLGIVGALWGAAVGHQVGMRQQVIAMRRPGFLPHQTPGVMYDWTSAEETDDEDEGIHLGRRGWPR